MITRAKMLTDQICGCANREQHKRDVALLDQAFSAQRELGAREERALVVAWLRTNDCEFIAGEIERGEHLTKGGR